MDSKKKYHDESVAVQFLSVIAAGAVTLRKWMHWTCKKKGAMKKGVSVGNVYCDKVVS